LDIHKTTNQENPMDSSANRSTTNKEQENKYGCEYSSAGETGEKHQGSKNTTKGNVGSEDTIANENINNEEHEDKSDCEDSSATKTEKKCQGSKKASEDVRADGSATNEEQQDEADYEDSSASENGKKRQGSKSAFEDDAASEDASANGNATIEEQDHDSYSEDSSAGENRKKCQGNETTSEDDAASEDASANGNATIEEQEHNSDSEDSSANGNGKKSHGSKNASKDDAGYKEEKSDAAQEELKDHDKLDFVSASEDLNANIATTNEDKSTCNNTRTIDNTSTFKSRNAVSSKHITPILSTNYLLTKKSVTSLSLFTLSLFLHETNECLIHQPNANYHTLVMNNLKKKSFQTAMTIDTNDITEEIYITVYEIAKNNNSSCVSSSFPKIHATYPTQENTYEQTEIPGLHAIDPTKEGLLKLIATCQFTNNKCYCFNDDIHATITDIFSNIKLHQEDMLKKVYLEDHSTVHQNPPTIRQNLYERYRQYHHRLQKKHPIRIDIAGGLHRTALVTHHLGNWKIHNAPPTIMDTIPLKPITIISPLNKDIAVHILSPKAMGSGFTNSTLQKYEK